MALTLASWFVQLGNAGAVRNAATAVAQRRAAEARADALLRRFSAASARASSRPAA